MKTTIITDANVIELIRSSFPVVTEQITGLMSPEGFIQRNEIKADARELTKSGIYRCIDNSDHPIDLPLQKTSLLIAVFRYSDYMIAQLAFGFGNQLYYRIARMINTEWDWMKWKSLG